MQIKPGGPAARLSSGIQVSIGRSCFIGKLPAVGLALLVLAGAGWPLRSAGAAPKPLTLAIKSIVPRPRSQSPQTVEVDIGCNSPQLIEGRLEIKWYVGQRLVHDYQSPDLAVTAGGQRFRLLLPPILIRNEKTPVTAYARFLTEQGAIDLGDFNVIITARSKRSFVVAVVQPQEFLASRTKRGPPDALALEQFNPYRAMQFKTEPDAQFDMLSYAARLTPEEMPATAAGYSSFDLLLLEGEGFTGLRARQLSAIRDWVAAGGSVVIGPYGKMAIEHVDFLNRISGRRGAESDSEAPPAASYSLDESGHLIVPHEAEGIEFLKLAPGLGRALILQRRLPDDFNFDVPEWKRTVAFLWKVRERQVGPILKNGVWDFAPPQPQYPGAFVRPYAPHSGDTRAVEIRQLLLPERIEGVPLPVVVVILALYLLAVAPGDYFLLGRFNSRKYTWGLFVLISAVFTTGTVLIARNYMGQTDYRTALVFADLDDAVEGERARLARVTRFEMLFAATQRVMEFPVRNSLYVDITDRASQQDQARNRRSFAFADEEELDDTMAAASDLPVYCGVMPASYSVVQQMRQWSPRVTRTTSFGDQPELLGESKIDWSALHPESWHSPSGRQALRDAILAKEPGAEILLIQGRATSLAAAQATGPQSTLSDVGSLARSLSAPPAGGFFAVVSQVAPTGSEFLEDLGMLDESDPEQSLLLVIVRREGNWVVFRKLFRGRIR
jgi:hypothetical protein